MSDNDQNQIDLTQTDFTVGSESRIDVETLRRRFEQDRAAVAPHALTDTLDTRAVLGEPLRRQFSAQLHAAQTAEASTVRGEPVVTTPPTGLDTAGLDATRFNTAGLDTPASPTMFDDARAIVEPGQPDLAEQATMFDRRRRRRTNRNLAVGIAAFALVATALILVVLPFVQDEYGWLTGG